MRPIAAACLFLLLSGCKAAQPSGDSYRAGLCPGASPAAMVFVVNGAGDSRSLSQNLSQVVAETRAPLEIQTHAWSRGSRRYITDQVDHDNHVAQGRELAVRVAADHREYPCRRVHLVGHSAGCAVVLAAAGQLPPNSIDRIILLSASVCATYDLRPALKATRVGIDGFHSDKDRWVLGFGVKIVGTTEEGCRTAAGRVGFTPVVESPADAALYAKLRQHPWDPALTWSGNQGGHFGTYEQEFLRAYVLPLLE